MSDSPSITNVDRFPYLTAILSQLVHEFAAAISLAWAGTFWVIQGGYRGGDTWYPWRGTAENAFLYPLGALIIATILVFGAALCRTSSIRLGRVFWNSEVVELIDAARGALRRNADHEEIYEGRDVWRRTPATRSFFGPLLLLATLVLAGLLLWQVTWQQNGFPDVVWYGLIAFAMGEVTYVSWSFEGESIKFELSALALRWAKRRSRGERLNVAWATRALELESLLAQHGILLGYEREPPSTPIASIEGTYVHSLSGSSLEAKEEPSSAERSAASPSQSPSPAEQGIASPGSSAPSSSAEPSVS